MYQLLLTQMHQVFKSTKSKKKSYCELYTYVTVTNYLFTHIYQATDCKASILRKIDIHRLD